MHIALRFLRPVMHVARASLWLSTLLVLTLAGCGTTRMSDTKRTATEQLLISEAIDRAVMRIDTREIANRAVFLDTAFVDDVADAKYLTSALRHQLLASGCLLAKDRDSADVVVEARVGAIGTDNNSVVLGLPATSVTLGGNEASVPEVAVAKRSEQRGVAKLNVFAYERETGRPIWQSGAEHVTSRSRDRWLFGAGPFQDGDIHDEVEFAGRALHKSGTATVPGSSPSATGLVDLTKPRVFAAPRQGTPEPFSPIIATQLRVDAAADR
jgi:hypothetical protein